MLKLDHLTVVAPTLTEGVSHVRNCLGLDVPFGTRHDYMGTHNHRLQLGNSVYLEIVARDPIGWYETVFVYEGIIRIDKPDGIIVVRAEDFAIYSSAQAYTYTNTGDTIARFTRTVTC